MNVGLSNTPIKKSTIFSKYITKLQKTKIFKKKKDAETQTIEKSRVRYITFEQGRMLVIKSLKDKVDGDKYTQMR